MLLLPYYTLVICTVYIYSKNVYINVYYYFILHIQSLLQDTAVYPSTQLVKRIVACLDVRSNDQGDLVVTKGDQYDVREAGEEEGAKYVHSTYVYAYLIELCDIVL